MNAIDPEVEADLALRQRTEWERGRSREMSEWSPPAVATHWPCRGCKQPVAITEDALERKAVFDRELARRGEEPLDANKIAICDACQAKRWAMLGARNGERADKLAAAIRELRGGTTHPQPPGPAPNRGREVELVRNIIALGHPDPDGLIKAIAEARNQGRGRSKGAL